MGTNQNPLQGAVVGIVTMISTLTDGAFDAFVGMAAHSKVPPFLKYTAIVRSLRNFMHPVAFFLFL